MPRVPAGERKLLAWIKRQNPRIARLYLDAWNGLKGALPVNEIARILASGTPEKVVAAVASDPILKRAFSGVNSGLQDISAKAAVDAATLLPAAARAGVAAGFNLLNPRVLEQVSQLQTRALKRLSEGLRESFLLHMHDGIASGKGPLEIARGLREVVGLHPGQVTAVQNFEKMLREGNREALTRVWRDKRFDGTLNKALGVGGKRLSESQIRRMVFRYRERAIASNASTQARSAALDTYRKGQRMSWEDAIEKGFVKRELMTKTRNTVGDSRVREEHAAINGERVPFDEPYSNGEMTSGEFSYNCRCWDEYQQQDNVQEAQKVVPGGAGLMGPQGRPKVADLMKTKGVGSLHETHKEALRKLYQADLANPNVTNFLKLDARTGNALYDAGLVERTTYQGKFQYALTIKGKEAARELHKLENTPKPPPDFAPSPQFKTLLEQRDEIRKELKALKEEYNDLPDPSIAHKGDPVAQRAAWDKINALSDRKGALEREHMILNRLLRDGIGINGATSDVEINALIKAGILRADERIGTNFVAAGPLAGDTTIQWNMRQFNKMVDKAFTDRLQPVYWQHGVDRAFYNPRVKLVAVSRLTDIRTAIHEIGHHLEYQIPELKAAAQRFLKRRWEGAQTKLASLREITGSTGYRPDEVANPDHFFSPYVGKVYEDGATEVISMGLEAMWNNPHKFFEADPDHYYFILEILQGRIPA